MKTSGRLPPSPPSGYGAPRKAAPTRTLPGREWRQFKLLTRGSWRRLLQNIVFSRDADPMLALLWALALAMMPPLVTAVNRLLRYGTAAGASEEAISSLVLHDRLFFLIYAMLASALLAALVWDSLFPDRVDQEIVGVLPVRPRTLAGARLCASAGMAVACAALINVPSGLFYSFAQLSLPGSSSLLRLFAAHLISTMAAATCVFMGLMSLRGLLAMTAGERVAARVAIGLQLVTVVSFVEVFMFLPGLLTGLGRQLQAGATGPTADPLVWFAALYAWLAEGGPHWLVLAATAVAATTLAAAVVATVSLVPAAWMGRRALETPAQERAGGLMVFARLVATVSIRSAAIRGMFLFAVASLARSRRHVLVLATYLGLALAVSTVGLISYSYFNQPVLDRPVRYVLALPMVFVFFTVFGLKIAFGIPTDVDANWPFRLSPPTARQAVSVTRRLLLVLGVAPIATVWLAVTLVFWSPYDALRAVALMAVSGVALAELALIGWTKVPFAAAHEPASSTMRTKWPIYIVVLHVFGFMLADGQREALASPTGTWWYLAWGAAAILGLRLKGEWELRGRTPAFDVIEEDRLEVLNLSEASS